MKDLIISILWLAGSIIFTYGIIRAKYEKDKRWKHSLRAKRIREFIRCSRKDFDTEKNMKDVIKNRVS